MVETLFLSIPNPSFSVDLENVFPHFPANSPDSKADY